MPRRGSPRLAIHLMTARSCNSTEKSDCLTTVKSGALRAKTYVCIQKSYNILTSSFWTTFSTLCSHPIFHYGHMIFFPPPDVPVRDFCDYIIVCNQFLHFSCTS